MQIISPIKRIQRSIEPLRQELLQHPLYAEIDSLDSVRHFMKHHVFAVWDFMSMLKSLQNAFCGTAVPWIPPQDIEVARLVNEIVLGEESDENGLGGFASHFELYLQAMRDCHSSTTQIDSFVEALRQGNQIDTALQMADVPDGVKQFVDETFRTINSNNLAEIASAFTFGREDLLPDVFQCIVDELNLESGGTLESFKYYLQRHIELDGDEHGPLALRMIESICGNDESKWKAAEASAIRALTARKKLWDCMLQNS